ncbi:hypothetical protein [Streptomyces cucumeris]|uniref:hypothetical protein n=1 Tax=Streptomyces cucumeris TaxID=2962890 RepID=UPI003D753171
MRICSAQPHDLAKLLATIEADEVFMVRDGDATAATITLTPVAEEGLWTADELREPSLFINKLTVARTHAGQDLGGRLLDWAGERDHHAGAKWLRPDAWTTNTGLQAYYLCHGSGTYGRFVKGPPLTADRGFQGGLHNG